jgi:hypothetical protein
MAQGETQEQGVEGARDRHQQNMGLAEEHMDQDEGQEEDSCRVFRSFESRGASSSASSREVGVAKPVLRTWKAPLRYQRQGVGGSCHSF